MWYDRFPHLCFRVRTITPCVSRAFVACIVIRAHHIKALLGSSSSSRPPPPPRRRIRRRASSVASTLVAHPYVPSAQRVGFVAARTERPSTLSFLTHGASNKETARVATRARRRRRVAPTRVCVFDCSTVRLRLRHTHGDIEGDTTASYLVPIAHAIDNRRATGCGRVVVSPHWWFSPHAW